MTVSGCPWVSLQSVDLCIRDLGLSQSLCGGLQLYSCFVVWVCCKPGDGHCRWDWCFCAAVLSEP